MKTTETQRVENPRPFLCSQDGCGALVEEIPGYCPAHQGQPREYDFEPLPDSGPATFVRRTPLVLLLARAVVGPAAGSRCPVEIQRTDRGLTVRLDGEEEGQPDFKWEGTWSEWTAALIEAMGARAVGE